MKPWRRGDAYLSRSDNPPELSEAMSLWGFPADFDPTQLPSGMFMCVMDEFTNVRIAKGLQKPRPPEPPPMRIGQEGDTIDRAGVRRKADGTLRNFKKDLARQWFGFAGMLISGVSAGAFFTDRKGLALILLAVSFAMLQILKKWKRQS